jgi:hypothetical protein
MCYLKTSLLFILLIGFPAITFAEQQTIEVPQEGWGITFDAPPLSKKEDSHDGSNYAFRANSGRFNMSFFVEEPRGPGNRPTDVYDFYWSQASQMPEIDILSIVTSETPQYVRVQYTATVKFPGKTYRQKNVNYFSSFHGKWIDVHISVIEPALQDDEIFAAFDRSFAYANTQSEEDQKTAIRSYTIPKHGKLELSMPGGWREKLEQPPGELPPTILFQPKAGNEFKFLITALWQEDPKAGLDKPERLRAMVEEMGAHQLRTAVEKQLDVIEDKGNGTIGYYYRLTDKAPKPGEFEYAAQGTFLAGDLLLGFTFLAHEKDSNAQQAALEMLRNARHKPK